MGWGAGKGLGSTPGAASGRADLLAEPLGVTCFPPHWQVLVLLNVQHDLQAVAGAPLHGDEPGLPVLPRVEGVALPIAGEDLQERTWG